MLRYVEYLPQLAACRSHHLPTAGDAQHERTTLLYSVQSCRILPQCMDLFSHLSNSLRMFLFLSSTRADLLKFLNQLCGSAIRPSMRPTNAKARGAQPRFSPCMRSIGPFRRRRIPQRYTKLYDWSVVKIVRLLDPQRCRRGAERQESTRFRRLTS